MSGGKQLVKVVLRNPLNYNDQIDYNIICHDNPLACDWVEALEKLISSRNLLEKNFCFMGFPNTPRTVQYLCEELSLSVKQINNFFDSYHIDESFTPDNVVDSDHKPNHEILNKLHNHFEILQGTAWNLSEYYIQADYETKYAIRQLNNICHELENLILSRQKAITIPYWVRPSQITTFLNAPRYDLTDEHRKLFSVNGYNRVLGGVYMHWSQIGKTFYEVYRDEGAPKLTETICEAITELKYYSGEFDVEWGNDVVYGSKKTPWYTEDQDKFRAWMKENNKDYQDPNLSCGYLPIGQVDLKGSFGSNHYQEIWQILENHLDIYKIEVNGLSAIFDYSWSDNNYKQMQIDIMKPGYDFSSRR